MTQTMSVPLPDRRRMDLHEFYIQLGRFIDDTKGHHAIKVRYAREQAKEWRYVIGDLQNGDEDSWSPELQASVRAHRQQELDEKKADLLKEIDKIDKESVLLTRQNQT